MSSKATLSVWDYIGFAGTAAKIATAVVFASLTGFFRPRKDVLTYREWIQTWTLWGFIHYGTIEQRQWLAKPTADGYISFANKSGFTPEVVQLPHGAKACWIGAKDAKTVVYFLHGGGYINPASALHFQWAQKMPIPVLIQLTMVELTTKSALAPSGVYPKQLQQATAGLQYLTGTCGKSPSDIIVIGDSAGGNLASGLFANLCHPHPSVTPINLSRPLKASILVSPWVTFAQDSPSMNADKSVDYMSRPGLQNASQAFMSDAPVDEYNTPLAANPEFWRDLPQAVHNKGNVEIFVDSKGQHDTPLVDIFRGHDGPATLKVYDWLNELVA
ncbi:hypothetical protein KC340_g2931 [Hortaea werneckii]|nr:hypothetical protein KC342_g11491 [Hortaea werneckii]KAI7103866.1 hypothetical protein KC339_g4947 [Hortaea werneckii]KAI7228590.1 hypothetical protein KC365_g8402 [Hortaea werneckii]KAI7333379.1 hypothetical protein KC340_g2931 [Hortaea werneckii]KAI7401751.1 hypothetical protein KC328_g3077 [Hortaea werneckii]